MNWEDLQNEPTEDLIDYIKCRSEPEYKLLAESAFAAFTYRFQKEVVDKCRKLGKHWGFDREQCDLLADRTFEKFWLNPFKFEKVKCKALLINDCAKFYLFRMAQRCFCDYKKEMDHATFSPYDGTEHVIVEFPALETLHLPEDKLDDLRRMQREMDEIFSALSPHHKKIYLTYKAYEKKGFKLPRPLLQKLRDETALNQSSIRVYKKEAFEKIEEYQKQHGPQKK